MAKVTKATIRALEVHLNTIKHCTDFLRTKEKYPENQTEYGEIHSKEYFEGMAVGINYLMECILFNNKCYGGFKYLRKDCITPVDTLQDPEFAEWRRSYFHQ
jgi:hypothetical protein